MWAGGGVTGAVYLPHIQATSLLQKIDCRGKTMLCVLSASRVLDRVLLSSLGDTVIHSQSYLTEGKGGE